LILLLKRICNTSIEVISSKNYKLGKISNNINLRVFDLVENVIQEHQTIKVYNDGKSKSVLAIYEFNTELYYAYQRV
jgi:hypothetical protein